MTRNKSDPLYTFIFFPKQNKNAVKKRSVIHKVVNQEINFIRHNFDPFLFRLNKLYYDFKRKAQNFGRK